MAECNCNCHKGAKPCGICCADVTKRFIEPPSTQDKSKELLEKWIKGKS